MQNGGAEKCEASEQKTEGCLRAQQCQRALRGCTELAEVPPSIYALELEGWIGTENCLLRWFWAQAWRDERRVTEKESLRSGDE